MLKEAKEKPRVRVVYCTSYGGFGYSDEFLAFIRSRFGDSYYHHLGRSDPALIQAISDYGRSLCDKFPFILDDMRAVYAWKLQTLLAHLSSKLKTINSSFSMTGRSTNVEEFDSDLVAAATSFVDQMYDAKGHWKADCLGGFPDGRQSHLKDGPPEISLEAFAEMHPDFWMAQHCVSPSSFAGAGSSRVTLLFAHVLLKDSGSTRYRVEPDETRDAAIYEQIGLWGASCTGSQLDIEEIPALVDYSIEEYDGMETVEY